MADFAESNKETTISLYNKRQIYHGHVIRAGANYTNLVNFNFA